ncbi:gamma-glutamyl-gamma-aminobutyrate hydrolase family protein [Marinomonas sp. 15G1-11]|uniref:Gamma-glutamyl-gamma-aminobutyrate hydrolase family protein n=1 Tax=Marinomonas phaeophyticola TaxID=3004091 RepID=A0ABT4JRN5_9GAMM|nr:gamma-glutamyl-gamma-aminobutyrate hydrolase family protein [Marinomonas sp. 15G1-11]MCZ2721047.1 gamma-glutamyl-gamma-aminobutyrate hydrolase family protein [Marinomonas sp. 15G1-11]
MTIKPVIGITLDIENNATYANEPWYALRENYCSSVSQSGGLPICLPHEISDVDDYLDIVDGLIISGGMYDIHPALYNETKIEGELVTKDSRTQFELALVRGALERDIPLIGICGGMQILAVTKGAKLIQDIASEISGSHNHMQPLPHDEPAHYVNFTPGTKIYHFFGKEKARVNSVHHQSVKDLPAEIMVSAISEDQVIEAIEIPSQRFCLGFQWHPEYHINSGEKNVYRAFIDAARKTRK